MLNRTIGTGGLLMMLLLALAALGVGIALWSKVLTIQGVVRTGSVNAEFIRVFTDDDDAVDSSLHDSQDTGNCAISVGPDTAPPGFPNKDPDNDITSCDPAETGVDPKDHYDKDVGRCDGVAVPDGQDNEPQPGSQLARIALTNVYPSYHCTAWFFVQNTGTIPVHLHSVKVAGGSALPCQQGSTSFDLNADTQPDVEICVSGFDCAPGGNECREPQIHPGDGFAMDLDIHVLQTALQDTEYQFDATVCLHQWNEETGQCPQGKILLYGGNGSNLSGDLDTLKAHYEGLGYTVDYTAVWPADISVYRLVFIEAPGGDDDSGTYFFTAAQKGALSAYMSGGGRVAVAGDWGCAFGCNTLNDLVGALSGNISQNGDTVTPDGDVCAPVTDITADAVTAGLAFIDPSATSSLSVSAPAISLARIDPLPYDCLGLAVNGATYMARDGRLVVIGDTSIVNDFGFSDPNGDGTTAGQLATNLANY